MMADQLDVEMVDWRASQRAAQRAILSGVLRAVSMGCTRDSKRVDWLAGSRDVMTGV